MARTEPTRPRRTPLAAALLAATIGACHASPGTIEDALSAYRHGDYATALRLDRPFADQGNAAAQYDLGEMYLHGQGVPRDDAEAAQWFLKAADHQDGRAEFNIGAMYAQGQGVPQDLVQAHKWLTLAASGSPAGSGRDEAVADLDAATAQMTPEQLARAHGQELASVDGDTLGTWNLEINGGRWVWDIEPGGTYSFHSEAPDGVAPHAGKFSANAGYWSLQATNGYTDGGTYNYQPPGALIATGRWGTATWRRPGA